MALKPRFAFQIEGIAHRDISVRAASQQHAIDLFNGRCKGFTITAINGVEVVGTCEASGRVIMPEDDYLLDVEGGYVLRSQVE